MGLLRIVLLAFPLIELASLIWLGQRVGVGWTLLWVVGTGLTGLLLIQRNGWGMLQRLQREMMNNRSPLQILKSGMWGVLAGILLAFPGLISDFLAVPCLLMALLHRGGPGSDNHNGPRSYQRDGHTIIEGEWEAGTPDAEQPPSRLN